ncbi:MAG: hypothetical protein IBX63_08025 [Coriobacteriia bacterium]|nr:hypothetical protein [Coriobacteriia bacterium]
MDVCWLVIFVLCTPFLAVFYWLLTVDGPRVMRRAQRSRDQDAVFRLVRHWRHRVQATFFMLLLTATTGVLVFDMRDGASPVEKPPAIAFVVAFALIAAWVSALVAARWEEYMWTGTPPEWAFLSRSRLLHKLRYSEEEAVAAAAIVVAAVLVVFALMATLRLMPGRTFLVMAAAAILYFALLAAVVLHSHRE